MLASDWVEDEEPAQRTLPALQPSPPVFSPEPMFKEPELPLLAPVGGNDAGLNPGASDAGLMGPAQPMPPSSSKSPKWLDDFADAVTNGAKKAAEFPKKAVTGGNHLLHDPRFWTVTAGGAALGAAGVGTYFLLKNANKKEPQPQPVYYQNFNGQLVPVGPYQYGFANGVPAGLPANYPYAGYSNNPNVSFPGDHYVSGYFNKYGHWIDGYRQTNANDTMLDNFSSRGNINPYTMKQGEILPQY